MVYFDVFDYTNLQQRNVSCVPTLIYIFRGMASFYIRRTKRQIYRILSKRACLARQQYTVYLEEIMHGNIERYN